MPSVLGKRHLAFVGGWHHELPIERVPRPVFHQDGRGVAPAQVRLRRLELVGEVGRGARGEDGESRQGRARRPPSVGCSCWAWYFVRSASTCSVHFEDRFRVPSIFF